MKSKIILLGLNELNFDYIKFYINQGVLPNFKKIFEIQRPVETVSEKEYKLLEPWIQWATIHTGKTFKEHKVFRLGDIVNNPKLSHGAANEVKVRVESIHSEFLNADNVAWSREKAIHVPST